MKLSDLDLEGWLKTYRHITKPAEAADGPLYPDQGEIYSIVTEAYTPWY